MSTNSISLQEFKTNGITLRAAVEGTGPLVIMVHGWPELWYSWRHQIRAVADAGYRVVAPDVRGYGGSDKPHPVEAYDMIQLTSDVVGLIDALGEEKAILVGHDWGAPICWNTAVLQPDRVSAVAGLSVPYFFSGARCPPLNDGNGCMRASFSTNSTSKRRESPKLNWRPMLGDLSRRCTIFTQAIPPRRTGKHYSPKGQPVRCWKAYPPLTHSLTGSLMKTSIILSKPSLKAVLGGL